ncbi:MAG: nitrogen fixation protein NifZ [Zoogloeaceae bacterium]|nr:nitrogen fixation protein NifZ [Rhodocyclaceae bacterium]MCP5235807.1 nitrogen fixation protein NifZ [Zoogloeaceae bacterium]
MEDARYRIGELVFASERIVNDGSLPQLAEDAVLAEPGCKGVVVRAGHLAESREEIFLVRFEDDSGTLGPPVGCLADELASAPPG